ncbi:hypothetical protein TNCV_1521981 [Trichonephila clavipes]|nr:hypothetical protein TNCV_1521981 [Trichonephila clavipes]
MFKQQELFCLHNAHTATHTTVDKCSGSGGKGPLIGKRDIHPICCKIDGKLPILLFVKKIIPLKCDLIISDKLSETLNKETATHIGIREAEDWFRPIDLAKECDIYISSRSGSHKEIPITYGYTQEPFKNRSQNFKPRIKENYPQYLERENKNCYICSDSSHYARDCEQRFKPNESNDHIHNRIEYFENRERKTK